MPRAHKDHKTPEFTEALQALRIDVISQCGFEIKSVKECRVLQRDMQEHDARFLLGISTLRRFFNLLPSDNQFSITTLNTLARYARRKGFEYYTNLAAIGMVKANRVNWDVVMASRLETKEAPSLEELIDIMNQAPFAQMSGQFMEHLLERIVPAYEAGLSPELLRRIMGGARSRQVIVELVPPLAWMGGCGTPLFEAFLEGAQRDEERLYASGVLAMHQLYLGNLPEARTLLEGVKARISTDVHIIPATRVLGMQWLFSALAGDEAEAEVRWKSLQAGYQLKSEMTTGVTSDWEIHFCEKATRLIVLSGQIAPVDRHLAFLEGLQQRHDLRIEAGFQLDMLNIGKAWLLCRLGRSEEARSVFDRLSPEGHFPFDRTFGRIFHHALGEHLHPEEPLHRERVEAEVRSSGYVWLAAQLRKRD